MVGAETDAALLPPPRSFRAFEPSSEEGHKAEIHSIHTIRAELPDGDFLDKAVFSKDDSLEWFDT